MGGVLVSYYDPDGARAGAVPGARPAPTGAGPGGLEALEAPGWLEGSGEYNFTRVSASMLTFVAPAIADTAAPRDAGSRESPTDPTPVLNFQGCIASEHDRESRQC